MKNEMTEKGRSQTPADLEKVVKKLRRRVKELEESLESVIALNLAQQERNVLVDKQIEVMGDRMVKMTMALRECMKRLEIKKEDLKP